MSFGWASGVRDRCVVQIALGSEILLFKYEKEGSNDNYMAFFRGGRKRGNPAMGKKRMRQGEKETHNFMLWEKIATVFTK